MEVRIEVLSPPSAPKGFLDIGGVTPTSCKLTWQMPADNGGSAIQGYNVEKKDVERDVWVSCGKVTGKTMAVMKVAICPASEASICDCWMIANFVSVH